MRRACVLLALIVTALAPGTVVAHDPTEGENEYGDGTTQPFFFGAGTSGLTWFMNPFESAAEVTWDSGNNSQAVRFLKSSAASAEVRYRTNAQTPSTPECSDNFWYACTDYYSNGQWFYTVFNSQQNVGGAKLPWYWCDDPANPNTDCTNIGRITMHEIGHAAGLSRSSNGHNHQPSSAASTTTSMQALPAWEPDSRYNDVMLGACDEFELQREYEVESYGGTFAACTDHATGTAFVGGEIETVVTRTSGSSATICVGDSVNFNGTINLSSGTGLGRLAGNILPFRDVTIQRASVGGTFSNYATVSATGAATFSRALMSASIATWQFRAVFADSAEAQLDGDISATMTVSWISSGCPT